MSVEQLQGDMEDHVPEQLDATSSSEADPAEQPVVSEEPASDVPEAAEAPDALDVPEAAEATESVSADERAALLASVPEVVMQADSAETPSATEPTDSAETTAPHAVEEPGQPAPAEEVTVAFAEPGSDQVSIWPFVVYDIVWLVFAGVMVWQLTELPPGTAVYESGVYPLTLLGGLVLTAAGPVLIVASWLFERRRMSVGSGQVFLSALFRGSVATLLGVAIWWAALIALDQLRLGRLF